MLFGGGGIIGDIIHQIVDGLAKIHVNKSSFYNYADAGVDIHNYFKIFTQLLRCTGRHMLPPETEKILNPEPHSSG